ncbi:Heavy-metal-associated domain [Musa troglodytarum]|uniref:Heavy-metal-associated domain n=1 Tax=Musa troglodytarum TaxID=320322 RepID=A0A9E7JKM4_9LILI|nr:Heavy-metal-associated domain [Musa troglodytarum]
MASGEEASESLKYMTWVLKVSIHCEGCKKKVHRILKGIPGVYDTEIDARQNKVTVKASVDADTLIRKLEKSGKRAELWPEKKHSNQQPSNGDTSNRKESKEVPKHKEPSVSSEKKPILSESSPATAATVAPAAKPPEADQREAQAKPPKELSQTNRVTEESAIKDPQTSDATKTDISTKQDENSATAVAASASGDPSSHSGGGKKKGKKAQKQGSEDLGQMPSYPMYPPPPAYVMSYNMAQPSVSQAYYAPPLPPASQGYVYMPHPPPPQLYYSYPDPTSLASTQPSPQHDNMFSDENPNACNLM